MFRKIITYFLILAVVLPVLAGVVPFGAGVNHAQAAEATKFTSSKGTVYDPCAFTDIVFGSATVAECTSYKIVNFLYDWVLSTTIWIAGLAGNLFNASIQFSLTGKVFDADENTMIKDGWTLVRDLLNLIFIFILLFAAISTILQYGGFEIKKVLPSLIVVALLVNFSMMIAKMVIDASHIFAWEFYNQIDVKNEEGLGDGEMFANIKNDINVYGEFEKKNLANVFIAGFNPQELLTGKEAKEGEEDSSANKSLWKQAVEKKIDEGKSISDVWWQMGLIVLLESALALFAGFILLAGAIMFVVRVVVLWLVIIFSPIAFLGMILPSMKKYSGMWWGYLISQSFFAPAFLFMFMLVTKFINSDFVDSIFKASAAGTSDSMIVLGINGGTIALTFFHFFVVGGLMMACLIVAKQLGGKTAEFGISWAHKGKELALGATKFGINNRGTRYLGGKAGDSNWWAQSIGRIPGGNILGRKLGAMKKADEDKARKTAEKYAGTLSSAGRKSLASDMEGKGFMKRFMYTGPEGAFKPGKEGYEKIITKKNAEKEEEDRVFKKRMELMGGEKEFLDKFADIGSGDSEEAVRQKIDNAKQRAKSLIRQGDTAELDKFIEEKDKLEEEKNEIERDNIVKEKRRLKLEIGGYEESLKEARKRGVIKDIKFQESLLLGSLTDTDNLEKKIVEIVAKEKHRENLQKTVDKYDDKQRAKAGKPEEKKEKEAKSK